MNAAREITRPLTLKYVIALGLLGALAVVNFLTLQTEIHDSQSIASILNRHGDQRVLFYQSATIAERLIFSVSVDERSQHRQQLNTTIASLEKTHFGLMFPDPTVASDLTAGQTPQEDVRKVYEDAPWLLDSEMRNYVLHLRSVSKASDDELHYSNAHFKYVRNPMTINRILGGLNAVVDVYEERSAAKTAQMQLLAIWSLVSTLAVLLLDGWFVFRPMVRRVRDDVDKLNRLNLTLEDRVTERTAEAERRAELLAQSESALRDSEALYRSLVDHLPMCMLRKDCKGRFTFANEKFLTLAGLRLDQLVGRRDDDLYAPATAAKHQGDDCRVMETGCTLQDVEEHILADGSKTYVEVVKAPLHDAAGIVHGTQTVFWDVTERKEAEQRALHAERLAAIGAMVAGVAHESRNALQEIQACSQLLRWEIGADATKQELIADLQTAHDRLHRLLNELREYASPLKLDKRRCNVGAVLDQAWSEIASLREGREAVLSVATTDVPLDCNADSFQLEQVFRNILENALAACRDPVVIEVGFDQAVIEEKSALRVAFHDNGPGLTSEQRAKIFEPFFTTKTQGTGLGMAIAKQIVEAHRGVINVGVNGKCGAEIVVALPCS